MVLSQHCRICAYTMCETLSFVPFLNRTFKGRTEAHTKRGRMFISYALLSFSDAHTEVSMLHGKHTSFRLSSFVCITTRTQSRVFSIDLTHISDTNSATSAC